MIKVLIAQNTADFSRINTDTLYGLVDKNAYSVKKSAVNSGLSNRVSFTG